MQSWTRVPGRTHQAALAGKVIDAQSRLPIGGVAVSISEQPAAFTRWLSARALQHGASWEHLVQRPDRVRTAEDGCFCFTDLPDGAYTLSFALARSGHRYGAVQRGFTVARDEQGVIQAPIHEITLPPAGVRGQIQGLVQGMATALSLARVRVEHSGELAYSGPDGRFYLTGAEPGTRTLRMSAAGFLPATQQAVITEGEVITLAPVVLNPAS